MNEPAAQKTNDERQWSQWMALAQQGDEQAYEHLLGDLNQAIRAYLIARFGFSELVDDCVQDCLLTIHQARHTYDPGRPFRAWLFAIVRHKMIDHLRRARSRAVTPEAGDYEPDLSAGAHSAQLLAQLSVDQRTAIVLTRFAGLTHRECAEKLGVSESLIKIRVFRAVRKLKAIWEADPA